MSKQIKSRKRVTDFGEVYTNELEVNAILDLVKGEAEKINSTFLEHVNDIVAQQRRNRYTIRYSDTPTERFNHL